MWLTTQLSSKHNNYLKNSTLSFSYAAWVEFFIFAPWKIRAHSPMNRSPKG
jgi:hypothetical protein